MNPADTALALNVITNHLLAHAASHDDLDHLVAALDLVQHMCWSGVQLKDIPEPVGMDGVRKALAACVAERLAAVYSSPPHNQRQAAPAWCAGVPPSPVEVWLIDREWADGATLNPIFRRRNIMALEDFLSFV